MTKNIFDTVIKSLKANRFGPVQSAETAQEAVKLVLDMIPLNATVGIPGSTSIRQVGLIARLKERGNIVIDVTTSKTPAELNQLMRKTLNSDILLTSSNAVTIDGKLVNIDGYGNRVGGIGFGPPRVILVIGVNKVTRDVDDALDRIKNIIAPQHSRARGARTPCVKSGRCSDCRSPDRICNVTSIVEKKPFSTEVAIILVNEDLGLGWSPDWPEERKNKILNTYLAARKGYSAGATLASTAE